MGGCFLSSEDDADEAVERCGWHILRWLRVLALGELITCLLRCDVCLGRSSGSVLEDDGVDVDIS